MKYELLLKVVACMNSNIFFLSYFGILLSRATDIKKSVKCRENLRIYL